MKDEMDDSVREYLEFLFDKLNELVIEEISYSDYDQMNDWLGEIKNHVRRIGKKQYPMKPTTEITRYGIVYDCSVCNCGLESHNNYCPGCGQKIDWTED